jgi:hypothetical protein
MHGAPPCVFSKALNWNDRCSAQLGSTFDVGSKVDASPERIYPSPHIQLYSASIQAGLAKVSETEELR